MSSVRRLYDTFITVSTKIWWLWPIIAAVFTYALVMSAAIGQAVWFDEGYSILLAKQPVGELIALTGVDAHPPFYYLLLKAWAYIFGWGECALRSLSALFAAGTVVAVFLIVRKLFTVRTALAILPFLVLAPFALRYGYEIRMYALASFIGALATLVLVYAYKAKTAKLWVLYAALVALGMYTLYMMAAIWLAHAVWLLFVSRKNLKNVFRQPWVRAYIFAIVLFAVYLPTFFFQLTHSALPGIGNELTLTRLSDIASMAISFTPEWKLSGLASLAILVIVGLVIYLLAVIRRAIPRAQRTGLWLMVGLVVIPLVFFALTSIGKPIFVNRYMAHVIIYSYALIGLAVALGWRYGRRLEAGILAIVSLGMLIGGVMTLQTTGNYVFERMQRAETNEIRRTITCDKDTVIVADDPYTYIDSDYYFDNCDLRFYSTTSVEKKGGYAPLHDSPDRISSAAEVNSREIIHLHWDGAEASFVPDDKYVLIQSTVFGKQVVDRYELK